MLTLTKNVRKKLNCNEADQLVFQTDKVVKDLEGKVDAAEVAKATEAKEALQAAIEKNELEEIRAKKMLYKKLYNN